MFILPLPLPFFLPFRCPRQKKPKKIRPPGGWHGSAEGDQRVSWLKGLMDGFIPNFHSYFGDVSFAAMKPNFHSYFMLFWDKTIPC